MEMQEQETGKRGFPLFSTLVGASVGAFVGIVVGVLFAPKSGKETRRQVGDWVREKRDTGSDMLANIKNQALHRKEQVSAAIKAGKDAYQEAGNRTPGQG